MTTQTDPRERPEIRTPDDQESRTDARFDSQDARMDTQDRRMDSFERQLNANTAATNENTTAIRELKTIIEADRRRRDRAIQWLSIGIGALGALATAFAVVTTLTGG